MVDVEPGADEQRRTVRSGGLITRMHEQLPIAIGVDSESIPVEHALRLAGPVCAEGNARLLAGLQRLGTP